MNNKLAELNKLKKLILNRVKPEDLERCSVCRNVKVKNKDCVICEMEGQLK